MTTPHAGPITGKFMDLSVADYEARGVAYLQRVGKADYLSLFLAMIGACPRRCYRPDEHDGPVDWSVCQNADDVILKTKRIVATTEPKPDSYWSWWTLA